MTTKEARESVLEIQVNAASAGFYSSPTWEGEFPKIQILTTEELLDGAVVKMPPSQRAFKQAEKVKEKGAEQPKLIG